MAAFLLYLICINCVTLKAHKYMKKLFLYFSLLTLTVIHGQELNQFDTDGKRHGKWEKKYEGTNKLRYQGQFVHGKEVGTFKFYHKEAKGLHPSCIKEFTKTSDIVQVKYYTSTGIFLSEGKTKGKLRIGTWKYYERVSGVLIEQEEYEEGMLNGIKTSYYQNGKVLQTETYKDDLLEGKKTMYAPNGNIVSEYTYAKGKRNGYFTEYDNKGEKSLTGKYTDNKPRGVWKYYTDGKLTRTKDYTLSNNPKKKKRK